MGDGHPNTLTSAGNLVADLRALGQHEAARRLDRLRRTCNGRRIPMWYRFGMSKQIAVRLPDDIVDFIDQLVDNGHASSRAVVVARAIDRERRRAVAARDAAILAHLDTDPDLDSLAEHAARTPLDDLD